ncbi:LPS export ABC transporter periplasmic protein LptC [Caviibacterium pharyngocola]|uniref:Lipopolysaccharide export system protein LptC n=1 Tax=Caviibacterium pharyngocola TaxID=28159 RepID=A0A2M8RWB7_9PAST|nr:LPS export ABC transporter periplasmic protein LptC [Caviibacterium pharyngocola]PJG83174.1 LPS export ABC transporter periplasmic protein LptC [Caviibacterium pharyngocola]
MNIRWNIILSVIALGLLAWFYTLQQKTDDALAGLIKTDDSPEYVGQKMETTVYSPTGKKQYLAIANKVEHFNNDGHTDFQNAVVYLFDVQDEKLGSQSWKISADKAKLTKDNMLYLDGNVLAESLIKDSRLQKVETQSATVNLKTQDITSDTMVMINGQNFHTTGSKLTGNLQQQTATLKEQVRTYYEIINQ